MKIWKQRLIIFGIFSLFLAVTLPFLLAGHGDLFFEDWEDNNFDNWTNTGFTIETSGMVTPPFGTYAAGCLSEVACDMNTIQIDTSGAGSINVSFYLQDDDMEPADCDYYWNSSSSGWVLITSCDGGTLCSADDVWCYREDISSDSQYLHEGFAIRFNGLVDKNENMWLDNINISHEEAPTDTCTYSSGDWIVDCSDNCDISSPVNIGGNDIHITGTGTFTTTADISNFVNLNIAGTDGTNRCEVTCNGGCFVD